MAEMRLRSRFPAPGAAAFCACPAHLPYPSRHGSSPALHAFVSLGRVRRGRQSRGGVGWNVPVVQRQGWVARGHVLAGAQLDGGILHNLSRPWHGGLWPWHQLQGIVGISAL